MPENDGPGQVCRRHELLEETLTRLERSVQDGFSTVNGTLREVAKDLREGAVEMATLRLRITLLERLVFGSVALALTGLGVALFNLVVKQ